METLFKELFANGDPASLSSTIFRLCLAAVLGGIIGLEREMKHKAAGLRTNMFICFGSAMFTILSAELASKYTGDHTRIAAQIIPGIGFIGGGAILHSKVSVTGLTTAATIFVVASVGMAVGGGLYLPAVFATLVIFVALEMLGWVETHFNLKPSVHGYEVVGENVEAMLASISTSLEELHKTMQSVRLGRADGHFCVQFAVEGTQTEQDAVFRRLRALSTILHIESLGATEQG